MRTNAKHVMAVTIAIAAFFSAPAARADILDDILGITTAARDRATEARNNAATARDRATQARDNAASARDIATTARDTVIEVRDNIRAGLDAVTAEMQAAISEIVQDMQTTIADEVAGRDAFLQSGAAGPFRQQLIELFQRFETLANTLTESLDIENRPVDFARFITLIESLPDRALYPIYRVLSVEMHLFDDNGISLRLEQANTQLHMVAQVLDEPSLRDDDGDFLDSEAAGCAFVLENYADLKALSSELTKFACEMKFLGFILKVAGETEFQGTAGAVGCVGGTIKNNLPKKMGVALDGVGSLILSITSAGGTKMRHCALVQIQIDARTRDQKILALLEKYTTTPQP